jgi:hypothetical protein
MVVVSTHGRHPSSSRRSTAAAKWNLAFEQRGFAKWAVTNLFKIVHFKKDVNPELLLRT